MSDETTSRSGKTTEYRGNKRVNLWLREDQWRHLRDEAHRRYTSMSALIREVIDERFGLEPPDEPGD